MGENQTFKTSAFGRSITQWLFKYLGIPIPLVRGRWGLPWLVPRPGPIDLIVGRIIKVDENSVQTEEKVNEI